MGSVEWGFWVLFFEVCLGIVYKEEYWGGGEVCWVGEGKGSLKVVCFLIGLFFKGRRLESNFEGFYEREWCFFFNLGNLFFFGDGVIFC